METKPNLEILKLLEENLINPKSGINDIYERIQKYYERSMKIKDGVSKSDLDDLEIILPQNHLNTSDLIGPFKYLNEEDIRTLSIDFPVHLRKNGAKRKTVMICAMDPLPPDSNVKSKNIIPWAPFSLICNWELMPNKQNAIFFDSLFKNVDLYVTDIYKVFFRICNTSSRSNMNKKYLTLEKSKNISAHTDILAREIEIIKPEIILTLGNNSRDAIYELANLKPQKWDDDLHINIWSDKKTKLISIPHISKSANGAKAKILNNPKYKNVLGSNNEKYANILLLEAQ